MKQMFRRLLSLGLSLTLLLCLAASPAMAESTESAAKEAVERFTPIYGKPGKLESEQDPDNDMDALNSRAVLVGGKDAFGVDLVVLLDGCADLYAPKTVRASMGAVFRQPAVRMDAEELVSFCRENGLPLYGAALTDTARDLRSVPLDRAAVLIGSEGHGLSRELLQACDGELIIPMSGEAESLNAAVAAAVIMWEMQRS